MNEFTETPLDAAQTLPDIPEPASRVKRSPKPSSAAQSPHGTLARSSRSSRPPKPRGPAPQERAPHYQASQATRPPNHQAQRNELPQSRKMAREPDGPSFNSPAHRKVDAPSSHSQAVELGNDGAPRTTASQNRQSPVVAEIVQMWRLRQRWHRAEKSLILQGKALCRSFTGGDKEQASAIFDQASAGKASDPIVSMALLPFLTAIGEFEPKRKAFERRLEKLAQSLPIWPWIKGIKGFGALNLAALIGEAGNIGSYRNPSCLWKRMGLAVIDGGRQRKIADKDLALVHSYSPRRRSVAWNIGCCLIKKPNRYRIVYDERKAQMLAREGMIKGHAHNDAMRFMTKRVLRDLWVEWPR